MNVEVHYVVMSPSPDMLRTTILGLHIFSGLQASDKKHLK